MTSTTNRSIWYVYGIVASDLSAAPAPAGIDDASVVLERREPIAALVSVVDGREYAPESLERVSGDVEWLSPRAVAHDRVLTWASDQSAVVPLPMFSLFSSGDAVQAMLAERSGQLTSALARVGKGREYALRIYRVDAELLEALTSVSPRLAALATTAAAASPGQRYLLERKLEGEKRTEMRAVSEQIVDGIMDALAPHALQAVRSPIPRVGDADAAARGTMVLNAAFLVAPDERPRFQETLTELVARHAAHGFRFDFTGPWPPYHFVADGADGA